MQCGDRADDDVLAELVLESENRLASEQGTRKRRSAQNTRRRLFVVAVMFLSQLFLELGRRALQCLQRNVPRCGVMIDWWLLKLIRVSVFSNKSIGMLRLLLALSLAFALPYIVLTTSRMRFPIGQRVMMSPFKLNEGTIRSHIVVDRFDAQVPKRHEMLIREGGDGLQVDKTDLRCENTIQGRKLLTDSMGYVCTRSQLDKVKLGCCDDTNSSLPRVKQYTCDHCDTNPPHCCDVYEHCVSCCMHPLNSSIRRDFLTHADPKHPVYSDPASISVFQYCQYRCRTSSASVQHQNSYRSLRSFCYGIHRPLKVLPTANSDGCNEKWSGASREGLRDYHVPTTQLELDPYYMIDVS